MSYNKTPILRCHDLVKIVFQLTGDEGFIAGGFARYCVSKADEPNVPGDIDVFCKDDDTYNRITERFKKNPSVVRKSASDIEVKYEYRIAEGYHKDCYNIQLIRPVSIFNMVADGDWPRILDNFDFTIAKCAIISSEEAMVHEDFHDHDASGVLVVTNIHCPISSMKRAIKYCTKGFSIPSRELLKLFKDYESRPQDWKDLITLGLSTDDLNTLDGEDRQNFVRAMYFD